MKGAMRRRATSAPDAAPLRAAAADAGEDREAAATRPALSVAATTTVVKATAEPTDRSMPPLTMTRVMPTAADGDDRRLPRHRRRVGGAGERAGARTAKNDPERHERREGAQPGLLAGAGASRAHRLSEQRGPPRRTRTRDARGPSRPRRMTAMRSAMPRSSGSQLETSSTALPRAASSSTRAAICALLATSMPRVGSSRSSTSTSWCSRRAICTFCWLPPESSTTRWSGPGAADAEPLDPARRRRARAARQSGPRAPELRERRRCRRSRASSRAPRPCGPRWRSRRPAARRRAGRSGPHDGADAKLPRGARGRGRRWRAAARSARRRRSPAMPSTSPRRSSRRRVDRQPARPRARARRARPRRACARRAERRWPRRGPPSCAPSRHRTSPATSPAPTVAPSRSTVKRLATRVHLLEEVRDVEDGRALARRDRATSANRRSTSAAPRLLVGSSSTSTRSLPPRARAVASARATSTSCRSASGSSLTRAAGRRRAVAEGAAQRVTHEAAPMARASRTPAPRGLDAERRRSRRRRGAGRAPAPGAPSRGPRARASAGPRGAHGSPSMLDGPRVRRDHARERPSERALAGAVLAEHRMHLARRGLEVHAGERGRGAERLAHAGLDTGMLTDRDRRTRRADEPIGIC